MVRPEVLPLGDPARPSCQRSTTRGIFTSLVPIWESWPSYNRDRIRNLGRRRMRLVLATIILALSQSIVAAETPPASCASKFIGAWTTTILATGQTYPQIAGPDGIGHSYCPLCNDGTWTCSGNTFYWSVNGISGSGTLSPDGRTITGAGAISRRSGPRIGVSNPTIRTPIVRTPTAQSPSIRVPTVHVPTVRNPKVRVPTVPVSPSS